MEDYKSDLERKAYTQGILDKIHGFCECENPFFSKKEMDLWSIGWNETGSILFRNIRNKKELQNEHK